MKREWYAYLLWIVAAAVVGFTVAAIFAGMLHLQRTLFLVPYTVLIGAFLYSYCHWSGVDLANLIRHNWMWGLIGAVVLSFGMVNNVLSQPASSRSSGLELAFDLFWSGCVYGMLDGLLLSVLPVLATRQAFSAVGWNTIWQHKITAGVMALAASTLVTAAYHLGYPEYYGPQLIGPVFGNSIISLGYLLTNNPITAIFSHIAMHITAVLHGPATVVQLPPHY